MNHHPQLLVAALILSLPLFWTAIVLIIARASGWRLLARRFLPQQPYSGARWKWQSAMMRGASYNGCLIVGADPMGLFLSVMIMFRPGHPALFIPWNEIALRHDPWLPQQVVTIKLGQSEQIPLRLRGTLATQLQHAALTSWPLDYNAPDSSESRTPRSTRFIVK